MLRELRVRNFATIEDARIECGPGLNVLTGETGAGKTVLIDALGAAVGHRAPAELVRTGASEARVEALFDLSESEDVREQVEALGVSTDDGALLLVREIGGRPRAYANGGPLTVGMLREIGALLVEVYGQHEGQRLLEPRTHLYLLDAFGGEDLRSLRDRTAGLARRRAALSRALADLDQGDRDRARRLDLLRYQIEEIDAAGLREGELDALLEAHARLTHSERLRRTLGEAYEALYGDDERAAIVTLGRAQLLVKQAAGWDPALSTLAEAAEAIVGQAADCARDLRRYLDRLDSGSDSLGDVERRLETLRSLMRKYGDGLAEVLAYRHAAAAEAEALSRADALRGEIAGDLRRVESELSQAALHLSRLRRRAAHRLEATVARHLADLAMSGARFEVSFSVQADPDGVPVEGARVAVGDRGIDRVEFLLSSNPGEHPRPLHRVASGGELARIMLALRSGLAGSAGVPVMVFDEVDAGVAGRAGYAIGWKLASLAERSQVLCVTHLPQVAAMAAHHIVIRKAVADGRTRTEAERVDGTSRIEEIARMLSGARVADTARDHARQLLCDTRGREAVRARGSVRRRPA